MAGEETPVGGDVQSIGADATWAEARSALAWWLESGVDVAVQEEARDWLKPPAPRTAPAEPAAAPNLRQPDHETLFALQAWLASSAELPLASASAKRILPQGPDNAPVMLLADSPALEDFTAGQPIGGGAWTLMQRMLVAIQIDSADAYSASLSCFHSPGTRMSDKDRAACAEIARSHIRLARPQRLLLLGDGPCLAMLGKRLVEARGHVHKIEGVRTVATFHPRALINQPSNKSLAWRDLLLLMEDTS